MDNLVRESHEAHSVKFHLGRTPAAIHDKHVELDDGTTLDCDLVVVGIGVRPNTELAEQAGIAADNGALVNEFLETNVPGIFAAGDIARWPDPLVVGTHGRRDDRSNVSGDLEAKNASVIFKSGDKLTAVASVGRDRENLEAEVALECGGEFRLS